MFILVTQLKYLSDGEKFPNIIIAIVYLII